MSFLVSPFPLKRFHTTCKPPHANPPDNITLDPSLAPCWFQYNLTFLTFLSYPARAVGEASDREFKSRVSKSCLFIPFYFR